ncbi:universal stress protein [Nostoc sp. LEGE 06077]|nr:universal stress protein [Nostoc sp. LEGE 06077]
MTNPAIAKGVAAEFTQELGDPSRMICEVARTWKADVIVISRRGLSGISELFLGSVSNYVLHYAPCSVLTVQGEMTVNPDTPLTSPLVAKNQCNLIISIYPNLILHLMFVSVLVLNAKTLVSS